jgi:hypothetical protein
MLWRGHSHLRAMPHVDPALVGTDWNLHFGNSEGTSGGAAGLGAGGKCWKKKRDRKEHEVSG